MVPRRIPVARVAGIDVAAHLSWFPVLAAVCVGVERGFAQLFPAESRVVLGALAVVSGLGLFASLTLHELAHALVANRLGVRVRSILLFMFGGVAEIDGEAPTPGAEFAIALVGPAVSVALGSGSGVLALAAEQRGRALTGAVFGALALMNLGVALFNLVPGLPLDGGRILRAALWRATGDRARATRIAGRGGRVLAVGIAAAGAAVAILGDEPLGLWYVPMGGFLWIVAVAAARRAPPEPVASARGRR
ncbi:MAG: site-2 protease family protein [Actinomycetota bacterium]